jgi:hypothetical protein
MNGPFKEEYWKAALKEIETLEAMDAWEVVDRDDSTMNVIDSSSKDFPMARLKSSRQDFVRVVINNSKVSISSKLMHQLCSGLRLD